LLPKCSPDPQTRIIIFAMSSHGPLRVPISNILHAYVCGFNAVFSTTLWTS
jgi:hypothetical protein